MKILIVDDEPLALKRMNRLLTASGRNFEIIEADCGKTAIEKIRSEKPFAVFLDIQMPDINGFEVLESLSAKEMPFIIFVTAFNEYAVKAFEKNAIDYLLKPLEQERLEQTIKKLEEFESKGSSFSETEIYEKLNDLLKQNAQKEEFLQRLQVKVGDRTFLIAVNDIVRFESDDKYTAVYTKESKHIIDTPLVNLESKLDPRIFVRVHRAHLVAISGITEIRRNFPGKLSVILNDNKTVIPVGRNFIEKVREL